MSGEKIFIVEDERIVAEDLKRMLERIGYSVVGSVANGEQALKEMARAKPDLALLDIRIQGKIDGVDVAEYAVSEFDIPVIYLTAYADEPTLDRAIGTLPSAYILKPFDERGLKTTIDLALYRHKMDQLVRELSNMHGTILTALPIAVIAVDLAEKVTYLNKAAEQLTKQTLENVLGKTIENLSAFKSTASPIKDDVGRVIGKVLVLMI
jgi:AmiR/NasT family two-component response regulator